jgi:O-antigen/teichoic acid export membrane protein
MERSDSTFKPALMLMSGRAVAFAVTFFVPAVLTRVFSQSEFGTYKQFWLITYTLFGVGQFGLSECLFYFLPANPKRAGQYIFNSLVMLGLMGGLFAAGLILNASRVARWVNNEPLTAYMPLAALYLLFMLMGTVLEITMINRKSFRLATATYVISDVLRAAFLILPALITRNLNLMLMSAVVFCALRVVAMLFYFRAEFGNQLRFDTSLLREQLGYTIPYSCAIFIQIIQQNYHQYAVSWHFDAATFAIYSVGCLQIPLVDFMFTPTCNVMMVQMGEHLREGQPHRVLMVWKDTVRRLALVFLPLVGLLVVNAYPLITLLYTSAYAASVPIFMLWSLSILFSVFPTDGVLRTYAENRWLLTTNITRLVMIVALMGWFIFKFHLIGAVLITLSGMLLAKVMHLARVKTLLRVGMTQLLPWSSLGSILLVSMISAIPSVILNAKLDVPLLILLPVSGMAYSCTFALLVLLFGLLTPEEKAAMKRSLYVWNRRSAEPRRQAGI